MQNHWFLQWICNLTPQKSKKTLIKQMIFMIFNQKTQSGNAKWLCFIMVSGVPVCVFRLKIIKIICFIKVFFDFWCPILQIHCKNQWFCIFYLSFLCFFCFLYFLWFSTASSGAGAGWHPGEARHGGCGKRRWARHPGEAWGKDKKNKKHKKHKKHKKDK